MHTLIDRINVQVNTGCGLITNKDSLMIEKGQHMINRRLKQPIRKSDNMERIFHIIHKTVWPRCVSIICTQRLPEIESKPYHGIQLTIYSYN